MTTPRRTEALLLLQECCRRGVTLEVMAGKLRWEGPRYELTTLLREALQGYQVEILALWESNQGHVPGLPDIGAGSGEQENLGRKPQDSSQVLKRKGEEENHPQLEWGNLPALPSLPTDQPQSFLEGPQSIGSSSFGHVTLQRSDLGASVYVSTLFGHREEREESSQISSPEDVMCSPSRRDRRVSSPLPLGRQATSSGNGRADPEVVGGDLAFWYDWLADLVASGQADRHLEPKALRHACELLKLEPFDRDAMRLAVLAIQARVWPERYRAAGIECPQSSD